MKKTEILDKAKEIISKNRYKDENKGEDVFETIANLWSAYKEVPFTKVDVCIMMALLKIARIKNNPKHDDSFIDLCGYAAIGGESEEDKPMTVKDMWKKNG